MPNIVETPWGKRCVRDRSGKVVDEREYGARERIPPIDVSGPVGMAGSIAASEVLRKGGTMEQAIDACVKARQEASQNPAVDAPETPTDPELMTMLRYVHAIARLHSGRFEDLTPQGMLEVAMLCPYPVVGYDDWKAKIAELGG